MSFYVSYPGATISGALTANQGAPNTLANAWPVKPTDGVNSQSFTALGEAKVIVTEPLPIGTNSIGAVTQSGVWTVGRTWNLSSATDSVSVVQSGPLTTRITDTNGNTINATNGLLDVIQPNQVITGTITSTQSVTLTNLSGLSSVAFTATGVWTGTIVIEVSLDGVNFVSAQAVGLTGGTILSQFTANTSAQMNVSGFQQMRLRGNTVTSGTATVTLNGNATTGAVVLSESLPNGGNTIGGVTQSGVWTVGRTWALASGTDSVSAVQSGTWNINTVGSITGTVTVSGTVTANQGAPNATPWNENIAQFGGTAVTLGSKVSASSIPVVIASDQGTIPSGKGRSVANAPVRNDYTITPVVIGTYTQLVAATTLATNMVEIFDSSGQALYFAVGAAGSEVNQFIINPGGNGQVPLAIPAGSRVSIQAITATANSGFIDVNFYT